MSSHRMGSLGQDGIAVWGPGDPTRRPAGPWLLERVGHMSEESPGRTAVAHMAATKIT